MMEAKRRCKDGGEEALHILRVWHIQSRVPSLGLRPTTLASKTRTSIQSPFHSPRRGGMLNQRHREPTV
jgi:hypothetical protein